MSKPLVSIIIVSFNTKDLLIDCLESIQKNADVPYEIIISDNGSTDGTVEYLKSHFLKNRALNLQLIENSENLGFAKGNNVGKEYAQAPLILFLNPDTILHARVLSKTIAYLKDNPDVGALTCKVLLPDGSLDKDTRRAFPTPFIALTHFSGLDRVFPKSRIFARYWYGYKDEDTTHTVDCVQGAFLLTRRQLLDKISWFDEGYFLDGEDIDLCWKIKEARYKITYYPEVSITHIKKGSKKKNKSLRSVVGGVKAMEIFYKSRMWSKYPLPLNLIVLFGIRILIYVRTLKFYLS